MVNALLSPSHWGQTNPLPFAPSPYPFLQRGDARPIRTGRSTLEGWLKVLCSGEGRVLAKTGERDAGIRVLADNETRELSAINLLARHGATPEPLAEEIRVL